MQEANEVIDEQNLMNPVSQQYSITSSSRGGTILHHEGRSYNLHKSGKRESEYGNEDDVIVTKNLRWLCQLGRNRGCKAGLITDAEQNRTTFRIIYTNIRRVAHQHSEFCLPIIHNLEHQVARQAILQAVEDGNNLSATYDQVVSIGPTSLMQVNQPAGETFSTQHSIARTARRRANHRFPPIVERHQDIVVPEEWEYLLHDQTKERFLIKHERYIINNQEHSIMIFGCAAEVSSFLQSDAWYMDGLFSRAPTLFVQLFTMHFFYYSRLITGLWCLLTGKPELLYDQLFQLVEQIAIERGIPIVATRTMVDFEIAIRNSLHTKWNTMRVEGCGFHYCHSIYNRMKHLGLSVS